MDRETLCRDVSAARPAQPASAGGRKPLSQRELIEHEKVHDLARSIVEKGYYPVEALIVVDETGEKYVVEDKFA